jgi:hypothetical protein
MVKQGAGKELVSDIESKDIGGQEKDTIKVLEGALARCLKKLSSVENNVAQKPDEAATIGKGKPIEEAGSSGS